MKQRLNKHYGKYGQRAQVETSFSMIKRRLTTTINARHYWSQCRELQLVVLCYNIMLLYAAAGFLQSLRVPFISFILLILLIASSAGGVWGDRPRPGTHKTY